MRNRNHFVGPVAMITVGVLFLLQYYTPWRFRQTWPLLLIAIGIALVMQRSSGSERTDYPAQMPPPAPGPDTTSEKR